MDFADRLLSCADCHQEFIFTAGEQLFFVDKQFKNDPKRCKPCKSRRAGMVAAASGVPLTAGLSRTETRTLCSECKVETTVPFKPTQGRPVLCRQCFQTKRAMPVAAMGIPAAALGIPAAPLGIPAAARGISAAALGVPATTMGVPAELQEATAELTAVAANEAAAMELNPAMVALMAAAPQA